MAVPRSERRWYTWPNGPARPNPNRARRPYALLSVTKIRFTIGWGYGLPREGGVLLPTHATSKLQLATRAESRLHLLGCVKVDEDGVLKRPSRRSLLGIAWDALEDQIALPAATTAEQEQREPLPDQLKRLPADFKLPDPPEPVKWTAPEEGREEVEIEFSWAGEAARHIGTVTHRWLQRIADDQLLGWTPSRIAVLGDQFAKDLHRRGLRFEDAKASAMRVASVLANAISGSKGRWVLGPHVWARTEYKVQVREGGTTRALVMDRVFRDTNGLIWVVDYKTGTHEGADASEFLQREEARYGIQMRTYAKALGNGAKKALFFPYWMREG